MKRLFLLSRLLAFFIVLLYATTALGQLKQTGINPQSLIQPSPDVYSLGKYGFAQIGKYTGSPGISIPLYTIRFEELELPIAMSYSQNGLKANEDASWVGLGWSLSSNAIITRSVKDGDDLNEYNSSAAGSKCGWVYMPVYQAWGSNPLQLFIPNEVIADITDKNADSGGNTKYRPDLEQDVFVANLFGTSVRFVLNKKQSGSNFIEGTALNDRLHTITLDLTTKSFTIIDGKGYRYLFSTKESSTTYGTYAAGFDIITSWFIDKITAPSGKELLFTYDVSGGQIVRSPDNVSESHDVRYCVEGSGSTSLGQSGSLSTTYTVNSYIRLLNISHESETVAFVCSDRLDIRSTNPSVKIKKLDKIQILFNSVVKKEILLHNSYFNQPQINSSDNYLYLRLKLDAISVNDQWHKFGYLQENNLPSKNSKSVDLWGYYNGKANTSRIPRFSATAPEVCHGSPVVVSGGDSDRDADYRFSRIGQLVSVQYPTGGLTELIYEPNTVRMPYNEYYSWERVQLTPITTTHTSAPVNEYYNFTLPVAATFSEISPYARIEFNLIKYGAPVNIYNDLSAHQNEIAIELISSSGTVHTILFGEFRNYCESKDLLTGCPVSNAGSYNCYCDRSVSFFTGTLAAGSYSIRLSPKVAGLTTSVKVSAPSGSYRNKEVGGLRVQYVVDKEFDGTTVLKRKYEYHDLTGYSSGILMAAPLFVQWNRAHEEQVTNQNPCQIVSREVKYLTLTSSPSNAIFSATQGTHIGYSKVTEIFVSDTNPGESYKQVSTFVNDPNEEMMSMDVGATEINVVTSCNIEAINYYYFTEAGIVGSGLEEQAADDKNGSLLSENYYDNSGALVKSILNTYGYLSYAGTPTSQLYISTKLFIRGTSYAPFNTNLVDGFQNYFRPIARYGLLSTIETTYDGGSEHQVSKTISYTNRWLEKETETLESSGNPIKIKTYYPEDYSVLSALINANIVAKPVKLEELNNGALTDARVLEYSAIGEALKEYRFETPGASIPPSHSDAILIPSGYALQTEMSYYAINHKPKESVGRDGIPVVYYWGYNNHHLVAVVKGVKYADITVTLSDAILQAPASDSALRTELDKLRSMAGAQVTTYTYNPLIGMTSVTDTNNITTYFSYDSSDRLNLIRNHETEILKRFTYHYKQ